MNRQRVVIGIVILAVIIVGGSLIARGRAEKAKPNPDAAAIPAVKAGNQVVAEATVLPVQHASLSFAAGGTVAEVLVAEGAQVTPGQVLVRLENGDILARLNQAEAGLAKAKAALASTRASEQVNLTQAKADFETAQTDYERTQALFDQEAVSRQQLEQAKAAYQKAEARLRQAEVDSLQSGKGAGSIAMAEADVEVAQAALDQARSALDQSELQAPFAATVAAIDARVGEFISPGVPIVRVADFSGWQIRTNDLTELSIASIKKGDLATITFDAVPDLKLPGTVESIQSFGEEKQGDVTYTVFIKPDRWDSRLRWNMTASVVIKPL